MSDRLFELIRRILVNDEESTTDTPMKREYATSPPWVLHVEDDLDFSEALKTRLESHGVAVVRAFDGCDGVNSAFRCPAEAIILDIEMPNGSGDVVLKQLKQFPQTRDIPVIILTCHNDQIFRHKMLELGAVAYLTKPLKFDELYEELAKHIDILPQPALSG